MLYCGCASWNAISQPVLFLHASFLSIFSTSLSSKITYQVLCSSSAARGTKSLRVNPRWNKHQTEKLPIWGKDKQLAAITSLTLHAKANPNLINHKQWGGNREACLCKFPCAVICMLKAMENPEKMSFSFSFCSSSFCIFFFTFSSSVVFVQPFLEPVSTNNQNQRNCIDPCVR